MATPEREAVDEATTVSFVCEDCGRVHNRNNPPCNDCGSMSLSASETVGDSTRQIDEGESWDLVRDANGGVTGPKLLVYLVGVSTLLVGVANLIAGAFVLAPADVAYGTALFLAGSLATPITRRRIQPRLPTRLSSRGVLVAYLALVGVGVVLSRTLPGIGV